MGSENINDVRGTIEEEKHVSNLINQNNKNIGNSGEPVKDNPHDTPADSNPTGPMGGDLMTFTEMTDMLEKIALYLESIEDDVMDNHITEDDDLNLEDQVEDSLEDDGGVGQNGGDGKEELLDTLNQAYTPVLVMQGIEGDIEDQVQEACSEDNILLERNTIKFDTPARMAQLQSVCALLIARKKNSPKWKMYKRAADIVKNMKIQIQREENAASKALAQQYLVHVSTNNRSSVARRSAGKLIPYSGR